MNYDIGDWIRIKYMEGEPHYKGREGQITIVDGIGKLHGTWGGLAVEPGVDEFEILKKSDFARII